MTPTRTRSGFVSGTRVTPSGGEAVGMTRERAGTRQRAEEVGGVLIVEPTGGVVGVHSHSAHRIDGEPSIGGVALSDGRDKFDRVAEIAQALSSPGLVQ